MSKASILMIVSKYRQHGGHEIVINNLCNGLTKLGHEVSIGAFFFEKRPPPGIRMVRLRRFRFLDWLNDESFDIYHGHQTQICYYELFGKKPFIFQFHGTSNKIQELNLKLCMALCKEKISRIVCVSKSCLDQLKTITNSSAEVIYNGVDTGSLNPTLPRPHTKGDPQLLFIGNLYPHKNVRMLVLSMRNITKEYPRAHLQIVGLGEDYQTIKSLIHKYNLEGKIELVGGCTTDEVRYRLSSCDIYISASKRETFGLPILEAMACGKPVFLSDIPAHRELIESSSAGLTFILNNETKMCEKFGEIYNNTRELGNNGRKFAEKCDWAVACKNLSRIYSNLMDTA